MLSAEAEGGGPRPPRCPVPPPLWLLKPEASLRPGRGQCRSDISHVTKFGESLIAKTKTKACATSSFPNFCLFTSVTSSRNPAQALYKQETHFQEVNCNFCRLEDFAFQKHVRTQQRLSLLGVGVLLVLSLGAGIPKSRERVRAVRIQQPRCQ